NVEAPRLEASPRPRPHVVPRPAARHDDSSARQLRVCRKEINEPGRRLAFLPGRVARLVTGFPSLFIHSEETYRGGKEKKDFSPWNWAGMVSAETRRNPRLVGCGEPDGTGRASPSDDASLLVGAAAPIPVGGSPTGVGL